MDDQKVPQPYGNGALAFLGAINLGAFGYIIDRVSVILNYKTVTAGSFTMGEAAYLGSLWSQTVSYGVLLLTFDILMIGFAICNRLSALHRAMLYTAGLRKVEPPTS